MKAMLLRVGIDKGIKKGGGALAPIFDDGSFEYIPIPEKDPNSHEIRTYHNIVGRCGLPFSSFIPEKLKNKIPHYDPEFETFTYGDPTFKRKSLLKLNEGDLLAFYAGLTPLDTRKYRKGLYFIGYFLIERILDLNMLSQFDLLNYRRLYHNNAHFKRNYLNDVVIAVGSKQGSKLLEKAIPISKEKLAKNGVPYHAVSSEMEDVLGISGSIQRSMPRFIRDEKNVDNLRKVLGILKEDLF
jgi:hypothetical protein